MLDLRLSVSLLFPKVFHSASHMTVCPYCWGCKPRADAPQADPPSFRRSRHSWSLRLVLLENSCLQWPREIGNWALRKGKNNLCWHYLQETEWSWKIVPKTPSGLHFELTDQKLSANYNTTPPFILLFSLELWRVLLHPFPSIHPSIPPSHSLSLATTLLTNLRN